MPIELKTFRKNLIYEAIAPSSTIKQDLDAIATIDKISKARQKLYTRILIGCILCAIGSIFLVFLFNELGVIPLIGFAIAAVFAGIKIDKHRQLNMQNQRYELMQKVLEMLERDMKNNAQFNVHLVFSSPTKKHKRTHTIPHPHLSRFEIDFFSDEWLKLQGQFLDKTSFILTITELYQTKHGWKRSRSGKTKHKSKSKPKGFDFNLTLTYSRRQYGAIKVLQNEISSVIKIPNDLLVKRLKVSDKQIELATKMPPSCLAKDSTNLMYQTIAMMYLSLYQGLNLAKMLSKN
jgi:hypothetical protein